jgi:hypothetical protein
LVDGLEHHYSRARALTRKFSEGEKNSRLAKQQLAEQLNPADKTRQVQDYERTRPIGLAISNRRPNDIQSILF